MASSMYAQLNAKHTSVMLPRSWQHMTKHMHDCSLDTELSSVAMYPPDSTCMTRTANPYMSIEPQSTPVYPMASLQVEHVALCCDTTPLTLPVPAAPINLVRALRVDFVGV
jgi:hypothetical protein